ncbi:MAG: hypothetical protein ABL998_12760 [Planctomycetota bacterium]
MDAPDQRPDCLRCRSFFVTYDPARPYGCRAFGFRSLRLPRDEVRLSSGNECHLYEKKSPQPRADGSG